MSDERLEPLNIVDNRSPSMLVRDGDDRWPDGSDYCPPQFEGVERTRFLAKVKSARTRMENSDADADNTRPA